MNIRVYEARTVAGKPCGFAATVDGRWVPDLHPGPVEVATAAAEFASRDRAIEDREEEDGDLPEARHWLRLADKTICVEVYANEGQEDGTAAAAAGTPADVAEGQEDGVRQEDGVPYCPLHGGWHVGSCEAYEREAASNRVATSRIWTHWALAELAYQTFAPLMPTCAGGHPRSMLFEGLDDRERDAWRAAAAAVAEAVART